MGLGSDATDLLVALVEQMGPEHGLYGAKITGGGSGGTVCILGSADADPAVREVVRQYERRTGAPPETPSALQRLHRIASRPIARRAAPLLGARRASVGPGCHSIALKGGARGAAQAALRPCFVEAASVPSSLECATSRSPV